MRLSYVKITTPGCEGWINLFFDAYPIAMISDSDMAKAIMEEIDPMLAKDLPDNKQCPLCCGTGRKIPCLDLDAYYQD